MFGDTHDADRKGLVPRMLEASDACGVVVALIMFESVVHVMRADGFVRTVQCLFNVLDTPNLYEKSTVSLSYLQVYNNEIQVPIQLHPAGVGPSLIVCWDP